MNAAVLEAESLGKFYRLILSQIGRNPAKDLRRLECLDQQVRQTGIMPARESPCSTAHLRFGRSV